MLNKMYESDFTEAKLEKRSLSDTEEISFEDKKFLEIMDKEIKQMDGHYQVPLPLRNANVAFPNNRHYAMTRLRQLEKRFERNQSFFSDYKNSINEMVSKGYAREAFNQPVAAGRSWYILHHGVYHLAKPEEIRLVFDCSAKYGQTSLNQELMSAPDCGNIAKIPRRQNSIYGRHRGSALPSSSTWRA